MKTLLILRHAKSSWKHPELADHDRPLNKRGERDAPRMGQWLRDAGLAPDVILSSTARRAADTARLVADACGFAGEMRALSAFYHAGPAVYLRALQSLPETVAVAMVVGHNPGMEDFLQALTGIWMRMPTAALAQVQLPVDRWEQLTDETPGKLLQLQLPRTLSP